MAGGSDQATSLEFRPFSLIHSILDELAVPSSCNFPGFTKMQEDIFDRLLRKRYVSDPSTMLRTYGAGRTRLRLKLRPCKFYWIFRIHSCFLSFQALAGRP